MKQIAADTEYTYPETLRLAMCAFFDGDLAPGQTKVGVYFSHGTRTYVAKALKKAGKSSPKISLAADVAHGVSYVVAAVYDEFGVDVAYVIPRSVLVAYGRARNSTSYELTLSRHLDDYRNEDLEDYLAGFRPTVGGE